MRQSPHAPTSASATFASRSPGQVLVMALVGTMATLALVAVVVQPALVVGLAVVALAVRMRHLVTAPLARVAHDRLTLKRRPAAE